MITWSMQVWDTQRSTWSTTWFVFLTRKPSPSGCAAGSHHSALDQEGLLSATRYRGQPRASAEHQTLKQVMTFKALNSQPVSLKNSTTIPFNSCIYLSVFRQSLTLILASLVVKASSCPSLLNAGVIDVHHKAHQKQAVGTQDTKGEGRHWGPKVWLNRDGNKWTGETMDGKRANQNKAV